MGQTTEHQHVLKARAIQKAQWDNEDRLNQVESKADDALSLCMNTAKQVQKTQNHILSEMGDIRENMSVQSFCSQQQDKQIQAVRSEITAVRNTAIVWGTIAALVTSLAVTLITAPNTASINRVQGVSNVR